MLIDKENKGKHLKKEFTASYAYLHPLPQEFKPHARKIHNSCCDKSDSNCLHSDK